MDGDNRPPSWKRAYPDALKRIENYLLAQRREALKQDTDTQQGAGAPESTEIPNPVGIALSGGGIRSATFCLGIFQGLAKQDLLSKIDYMSTVSGGGYFGSFYGRLFTRAQVADITDIGNTLTACSASDVQDSPPDQSKSDQSKFPRGKVFRWLRDNGRYLAPRGGGGILLDSAVMMRNWTSLQVVLATFMLMVFLAVQSVRGLAEVTWHGKWWWQYYESILVRQPWGTGIWWSPFAILPALAFVFIVVPSAWSYWLVGKPALRDVPGGHWIPPTVGLAFTTLLAFAGWYWGIFPCFCIVVFALSVLTAVWFLVNRLLLTLAGKQGEIRNSEAIRNRLSVQLKYGLILTGCLLGFVVLDSLAQTIYAAYVAKLVGIRRLEGWTASIFGMLTAAAGFGRSIFVALGSKADGKRISVPWSAAAGLAAVLVAAVLLVAFDVCSYAIAWPRALPVEHPPPWVQAANPESGKLFKLVRQSSGNYLVKRVPPATGKAETVFNLVKQGPENQAAETWSIQSPPAPDENNKNDARTLSVGNRDHYRGLLPLGAALTIAFLFSFLFGWSWPFLNRSTLHPLYTSRLIRAYLGASNPGRLESTSGDVTEAVAGDDLKQEQYWPLHAPAPPVPSVSPALRAFISAGWARKILANRSVGFVSKLFCWSAAPALTICSKGGPLTLSTSLSTRRSVAVRKSTSLTARVSGWRSARPRSVPGYAITWYSVATASRPLTSIQREKIPIACSNMRTVSMVSACRRAIGWGSPVRL